MFTDVFTEVSAAGFLVETEAFTPHVFGHGSFHAGNGSFHGPPADPRGLAAPGDPRRLLAAPAGHWLLLAAPGNSKVLLAAPVALAAPGGPLAGFGHPWRSQAGVYVTGMETYAYGRGNLC